ERIGSRQEAHTLGVSQTSGKEPSTRAIGVVLVNGSANGIAGRVLRADVAARSDGHIEVVVTVNSEIFQFVSVSSVQFRRAAVGKPLDNHLSLVRCRVSRYIAETIDLVLLGYVNVRRPVDGMKHHVMRGLKPADKREDLGNSAVGC